MTNEQKKQLRTALETAIEHRDSLISQRAEIEHELAQQNKAINTLSYLLGENTESEFGLTDATLLAIRTSNIPLTPTEIRDRLQDMGYDMDSFSNAMASLHQVLIRLKDKGLITPISTTDGKKKFGAVGIKPVPPPPRVSSKK